MPMPTSISLPSAGRNAYIDTLRGGSILGVVCIHFAGSFVTTDIFAWSPSFYLGLFLNQIFIFAVPLFIFLSGLLAGSSTKTQPLSDYYRGRLWRFGLPYLLASIASFFLLNHYSTWLALPDVSSRLGWLASRFFLSGIEPTLYFIPLIIYLYFIQPALKLLPAWLNGLVPAVSIERSILLLTTLLLILHVALGLLCFHGNLNYYAWARPNPLFWMFYFFAGLHFRNLTGLLSRRTIKTVSWLAFIIAAGVMAWNFNHLTDRAMVGEHFERNILDFAYVRPEMLIFDLVMVVGLAAGITLNWSPQTNLFSYLGRYTLEIYIWHILILYYGAWRYAEALASCRQIPELMIIICATVALLIASTTDGLSRLRIFAQQHRLVLTKVN